MTIEAIAVDIDGTITDEKRQIESAIYEDGEQLEGDYTYLYCNRKNLYVMPFDSEDNNILYNISGDEKE